MIYDYSLLCLQDDNQLSYVHHILLYLPTVTCRTPSECLRVLKNQQPDSSKCFTHVKLHKCNISTIIDYCIDILPVFLARYLAGSSLCRSVICLVKYFIIKIKGKDFRTVTDVLRWVPWAYSWTMYVHCLNRNF